MCCKVTHSHEGKRAERVWDRTTEEVLYGHWRYVEHARRDGTWSTEHTGQLKQHRPQNMGELESLRYSAPTPGQTYQGY